MKKFILIVGLFVAALSTTVVFAQNKHITGPEGQFTVGGVTTVDTLIASQTANYVLRTRVADQLYMKLAIASDEVSGTTAYTALLQASMNNATWTNIDTITVSGGGDKYGEFSWWTDTTNMLASTIPITHNYYRVNIVATSATQRSIITLYGNIRRKED